MIEWDCGYEDGPHEFEDDWIFGGADGQDPAADPRWVGSRYVYYSERLEPLALTSAPRCDGEALDKFTVVATHFPGHRPRHLEVRRPDGTREMLPWVYNRDTDTLHPRESHG